MVLGGLRRCEVLGLQLADLRVGERRVFIANGKCGHQRLIPVSSQFFGSVAAYLETERPAETSTDTVFVVLKGPRRGSPLSAAGLDESWRRQAAALLLAAEAKKWPGMTRFPLRSQRISRGRGCMTGVRTLRPFQLASRCGIARATSPGPL